MARVGYAPGRVNLIGDHTDYTGGLAMPMAIDRGTTVRLEPGGREVRLTSADEPEPAVVPLDVTSPRDVRPSWARYVAGVVAVLRPSAGGAGHVTTTLPVGAGLSSSAALELSVALALGFTGSPLELALACQRAEQLGSGVPSGVLDQMASAYGIEGHALLLDCSSLDVTPVPLPPEVAVVVVPSGERRSLVGSAYAERRAECERAEELVGPLRAASLQDVATIGDPLLRRRARHVVSENARVRATAEAFTAGDPGAVGGLMAESHASLRDDFEVSTPALDELVTALLAEPGVLGARLTGAGFGGCVVALTTGEARMDSGRLAQGWQVRASAAATLTAASRSPGGAGTSR